MRSATMRTSAENQPLSHPDRIAMRLLPVRVLALGSLAVLALAVLACGGDKERVPHRRRIIETTVRR